MSKTREKIAHRACELLETQKVWASCSAVLRAKSNVRGFVTDYKDFLNISNCPWENGWNNSFEFKHERIMAVLFWAYCPEDIRKKVMK